MVDPWWFSFTCRFFSWHFSLKKQETPPTSSEDEFGWGDDTPPMLPMPYTWLMKVIMAMPFVHWNCDWELLGVAFFTDGLAWVELIEVLSPT